MIVLGLTGSIGMGKSTTLRLFAEEGCAAWDADAAVHRLYAAGEAGALAVADAFPGALSADGSVDREALGRVVLGDPEALGRLEAVVHPLVGRDRERFLEEARAGEGEGGAEVAVLDVPLLFEGRGADLFDAVVVVTADEAVRRARVLARPGMTEAKLDAILARQMGEGERALRADHVIRTDEGVEATRIAVKQILTTLTDGTDA